MFSTQMIRSDIYLKMKFVDQTFNILKGYDDGKLKNNKAKIPNSNKFIL